MSQNPDSSQGGKFSIRRATNADQAAIRAVLYAVRLEYGVREDRDMDAELTDMHKKSTKKGVRMIFPAQTRHKKRCQDDFSVQAF